MINRRISHIIWLFVLVFIVGVLFFTVVETEDAVASGDVPANGGSDKAYLHIEVTENGGSRQWFNAVEDDPESDQSYPTEFNYIKPGWFVFGACIREGPDDDCELDEPIYLKEGGHVTGQWKVSFDPDMGASYPDQIEVVLYIDDTEQDRQSYSYNPSNIYAFDLTISDTVADTKINLVIRMHLDSGHTNVVIYSDGSSYFVLPLEPDTDNDGTLDREDSDDDNDGMPDTWEETYGLNPKDASDKDSDMDDDGLTNYEEYLYNTDPTKADTDGDGYTDYEEIKAGTNPTVAASYPQKQEKGFLERYFLYIVGGVLAVLIIIIIVLAALLRKRRASD